MIEKAVGEVLEIKSYTKEGPKSCEPPKFKLHIELVGDDERELQYLMVSMLGLLYPHRPKASGPIGDHP